MQAIDPPVYNPRVLPGGEVRRFVHSARKQIVLRVSSLTGP